MAKKILVVTKDIGGYNAVRKPAELLKAADHEVVVVAEGLSLARWQKDGGFEIYGGAPAADQVDSKTIRYDLYPFKVLEDIKPDVVVATMGSPINLEKGICFEANARKIPVVIVEDIWGCHTRAGKIMMPDLVCTLDSVGANLVREHYPAYEGTPKIVETGSPAFDAFAAGSIPPNRPLLKMVEGFDRVVYILGQDESTTPYLKGVLEAVREKNVLAIVGLHPKFLASPELCAPWLKLVKESEVPVLWCNNQATSHQYMLHSNIVAACYSTGLVEAGLLGKTTVSWTSEIGRQKMAEALGGLTTFPTVTAGVTVEISSPEGFYALALNMPKKNVSEIEFQTRLLKDKLHVDGFAAERVAQAIQDLIQ